MKEGGGVLDCRLIDLRKKAEKEWRYDKQGDINLFRPISAFVYGTEIDHGRDDIAHRDLSTPAVACKTRDIGSSLAVWAL